MALREVVGRAWLTAGLGSAFFLQDHFLLHWTKAEGVSMQPTFNRQNREVLLLCEAPSVLLGATSGRSLLQALKGGSQAPCAAATRSYAPTPRTPTRRW